MSMKDVLDDVVKACTGQEDYTSVRRAAWSGVFEEKLSVSRTNLEEMGDRIDDLMLAISRLENK